MADKLEFSLQSKEELIEIFPYGVTIGLDQNRPVLVFKDKSERHVLPVWLSPLDAGIAMALSGDSEVSASPHTLSHQIFKEQGLVLSECVFKEVKGHHQFVDTCYKDNKPKSEKKAPIRLRADYTMSLCIHEKVQFYSTINHMDRCRKLNVDLEQFSNNEAAVIPGAVIQRPGYLN